MREAQPNFGVGYKKTQKLIATGEVEPVWRVLASSKRKKQCFWQRETEILTGRRDY